MPKVAPILSGNTQSVGNLPGVGTADAQTVIY